MCLIVNNPNPQTSKENIFCYKVLTVENIVGSEDKRYVTPYRNFEPHFCEVLTAEGQFSAKPYYSEGGPFCISEGAFHSFETFEDANRDAHSLIRTSISCVDKAVIVECIIPAGTPYYKGSFCGVTSYASKKIIFSEIVREVTY